MQSESCEKLKTLVRLAYMTTMLCDFKNGDFMAKAKDTKKDKKKPAKKSLKEKRAAKKEKKKG